MTRCAVVPISMIAACLWLAACGGDAEKLSAEKTGDLSQVLKVRQRPDEDQRAQCGDGAATVRGRKALARRPYVQQVTASSALIAFRSSAPGVTIDVTRPDGSPVASIEAAEDASAAHTDGAWQGVADIEGLEPFTLYCYSLRGLTRTAGFRTAPAAGAGETVRFVVFGDSGDGSGGQLAVHDQMFTVPFDLVLHTGDIAYDSGKLGELEQNFFGVYADLVAEFPIYPVAGNHDLATADGLALRQAFVLPENGGPQGNERWYSFDWGDVHFAGLDTEKTGPAQAEWLDRDLASTDLPWKIVFAHKPPFSSGEHGSDSAFARYFVPVIEKHGVQLVFGGHDHDYERTRPISGTTYVVTGGGGRNTRDVGTSSFTAFSESVLHFVQAEVGPEHLTLHAIDATGVEFDSARIPRVRVSRRP
jgi:acid phosphatase type 7